MRFVSITGLPGSGLGGLRSLFAVLGVNFVGRVDPRTPSGGRDPSTRLEAFNDRLLHTLGGSWDAPPLLSPGWERSLELDPWRSRANDLLRELFTDGPLAGWADSSTSLLLPFWHTVVPELRNVVLIRHPLDAVRVITERERLDVEQAIRVWVHHCVVGLCNTPDSVLLPFDQLREQPDETLSRCAALLDLERVDRSLRPQIDEWFQGYGTRPDSEPAADTTSAGLARALYTLIASGDVRAAAAIGRTLQDQWLQEAQLEQRIADAERRQALVEEEGAAAARELERTRAQLQTALQDLDRRSAEARRAGRRAVQLEESYSRLRNRRSVRGALRVAKLSKPLYLALRRDRRTQVRKREERGNTLRATREQQDVLTRRLRADLPTKVLTTGPKVSIVMLNRSGEQHLRRCVPALRTTAYEPFELIVVDNASSDGSLQYLGSAAGDLALTVIRNDENRSFSEANNQGIDAATGELVLLLNNDIEPVDPRWLGRMVDTLITQDAAAVGARLIYPSRPRLDNEGDEDYPDLTLQHGGIHFVPADGVPKGANMGSGEDPLSELATRVQEVPAVTAACMLVRREALADVGGFTEGYVYGTEDVDLCLKLRETGKRIVYDGRVALYHHEYGTQNAEGRARKRLNRLTNRALFVERWGPRVFRQVLADRISSDRHWSQSPLHVGITLTKDDHTAGWGDWYTAHELGDQLEALGWRVSYLERYGDHWEHADESLDVVVALLDPFPLWTLPPHVVSIAWVRNWTDRWLDRDWFDDYDIVFASSRRSCDLIRSRSVHDPHLLPLATNPHRFAPCDPRPEFVTDVVFTGNSWGEPRAVDDALPRLAGSFGVRVFGRGWEQHAGFRRIREGHLPYDELASAYCSAKVVVDDAAGHTGPYGSVNSRVFDSLACGTLVVTNNVDGVRELFDEDFPTFEDATSLEVRVGELLANDGRRRELVKRYQAIVREQHTYAHRARRIRDVLSDWCNSPRGAICIGVPSREETPWWGDYHYARDLQRQLQRSGLPTRVHLLDEWNDPVRARADVVVHLFGLSEVTTHSGQVNVLWNISHPERVTAELCRRYDIVCTASDSFAEQLRRVVAAPVHVLHQATDPERFRPQGGGPWHELLFVANSRRVRRKILDDLLPTTRELAVYGRDWTPDLVDPRYVKGELVPNADLPRYYSAADIVLNDHWPEMREHAFVSNRIYDALACGAFVISDAIEGLEERFEGAVVTYRDREDLRRSVEYYLERPEERRRLAQHGREIVLAHHTFAHRAARLLELVQPLLADQPSGVLPALAPPTSGVSR